MTPCDRAQVRGRALKKEEQEQVDIAQRVLDVLKSDKDVRYIMLS